jgi:hypothetical protein
MANLFLQRHMMAFSMRCYKRIKHLLCACLLAWLATSASIAYSGLNIKSAELIAVDDIYVLNADIEIKLSDEIEQAIVKGFSLNFLVEFQLVEPRKYWFDDEIRTVTQRIILSYHALSRQFLVARGDQQKNFANIADAAAELSRIRDFKVLNKAELEKEGVYKATLLMRLDYKKLPKSLPADAVGSTDWKMNSQRYEWLPRIESNK